MVQVWYNLDVRRLCGAVFVGYLVEMYMLMLFWFGAICCFVYVHFVCVAVLFAILVIGVVVLLCCWRFICWLVTLVLP